MNCGDVTWQLLRREAVPLRSRIRSYGNRPHHENLAVKRRYTWNWRGNAVKNNRSDYWKFSLKRNDKKCKLRSFIGLHAISSLSDTNSYGHLTMTFYVQADIIGNKLRNDQCRYRMTTSKCRKMSTHYLNGAIRFHIWSERSSLEFLSNSQRRAFMLETSKVIVSFR